MRYFRRYLTLFYVSLVIASPAYADPIIETIENDALNIGCKIVTARNITDQAYYVWVRYYQTENTFPVSEGTEEGGWIIRPGQIGQFSTVCKGQWGDSFAFQAALRWEPVRGQTNTQSAPTAGNKPAPPPSHSNNAAQLDYERRLREWQREVEAQNQRRQAQIEQERMQVERERQNLERSRQRAEQERLARERQEELERQRIQRESQLAAQQKAAEQRQREANARVAEAQHEMQRRADELNEQDRQRRDAVSRQIAASQERARARTDAINDVGNAIQAVLQSSAEAEQANREREAEARAQASIRREQREREAVRERQLAQKTRLTWDNMVNEKDSSWPGDKESAAGTSSPWPDQK